MEELKTESRTWTYNGTHKFPTLLDLNNIRKTPTTHHDVHESIFRSYQILQKVKLLLVNNVHPAIIHAMIQEMEEPYLAQPDKIEVSVKYNEAQKTKRK